MAGIYTEADYEHSVIELFRNELGYNYVYAPDLERDVYSPLYDEILKDSLYREFSLFDPKFLEEVANMKEKNLAVELLKKLIAEQVFIYRRTNIVKSEKFSEIMQRSINAYLNGMLTNEEVIAEMLKLAKEIAKAREEGVCEGENANAYQKTFEET